MTAAHPLPVQAGGVEDFILLIEDALDPAFCAAIIARFQASEGVLPGRVGGGLMPELKHSRDLSINRQEPWRDVEAAFNQALMRGLLRYVRRYPFALIAPLMLQTPGGGMRLTAEHLADMPDATLAPVLEQVFRPGDINLQHYLADEGGYPYWHCELYPRDAHAETLHRWLLWTVYLNDEFADGETEFFYQSRRIVPRTGALLIAPTAFTHTHRGNRPRGGDKYIATSWVLFQRAQHLFPASPAAQPGA